MPLLLENEPTTATAPKFQPLATLAVGSLRSPSSRRNYARAMAQFLKTGLPLNREGVQAWLISLREAGGGAVTCNVALAAVRLLAREANMRGLVDDLTMGGLERIKGQPMRGDKTGNWLELSQVKMLLRAAETGPNGERNAALIALMTGCGLRRAEVTALDWRHWQQRGGRWCIVDLAGKGGRVRTVPCPNWAASYMDAYGKGQLSELESVRSETPTSGQIFPLSTQGVFYVVRAAAWRAGIGVISPHDLRRSYARLSRDGGASIEQISRTLGHASVQTTERYIGALLELRPGLGCGDHIRLDEVGDDAGPEMA